MRNRNFYWVKNLVRNHRCKELLGKSHSSERHSPRPHLLRSIYRPSASSLSRCVRVCVFVPSLGLLTWGFAGVFPFMGEQKRARVWRKKKMPKNYSCIRAKTFTNRAEWLWSRNLKPSYAELCRCFLWRNLWKLPSFSQWENFRRFCWHRMCDQKVGVTRSKSLQVWRRPKAPNSDAHVRRFISPFSRPEQI